MKAIDLVILREKIANYPVYSAYKKVQKSYMKKGSDLSYDDELVDVIEDISLLYSSLFIPTIESKDMEVSSTELDEFAQKEIGRLFKEHSYFLFRNLLKNKVIDSSSLVGTADLENQQVLSAKYESYEDLIETIYNLMHVIMYQGDKKMVYLDLFPQVFKLITASKLDSKFANSSYFKSVAYEQLDSLNYNIYINLLYPSLTPIFMPYSVGMYLAYEVFLKYQEDEEAFKYYLNEIIKNNISTEEYLKRIGADMSLNNIDKIYEHHQMLIK